MHNPIDPDGVPEDIGGKAKSLLRRSIRAGKRAGRFVLPKNPDWAWLNGKVMKLDRVRIGVEDRGFQFADGVYEVIRIYNGKGFALERHLERLASSAAGIQLHLPLKIEAVKEEIWKLVARSGVLEGMVYLQLTRGDSKRNHIFPDVEPTLLFYVRKARPSAGLESDGGVKVITVADERWNRCWIKAIALLPNMLAKNAAIAAGAYEAVFIDDGMVTECSASNVFAVIQGKIVTHPAGARVLPGITRAILLEIAGEMGIQVQERPFGEAEAREAQEIFVCNTMREIAWVGRWDDAIIGNGKCGKVTWQLHAALRKRIADQAH